MWRCFHLLIRNGLRAVILLLSTLSLNVSAAPDSDAGQKTLDLQQAVAKTLAYNPKLQVQEYRLKAQQGRLQQAKLAPPPELNVELEDFFGTDDFEGLDGAQATVSIAWILERGARQRYVDAARAGSSVQSVELDIKQLDAAAETARRYLTSLTHQARMHNADKAVRLAQDTVAAVRKRVKAGQVPGAELLKARVELARQKLEREDIVHEIESANRRLAAQWGETLPDFVKVAGLITHLPELASFETLKSRLQQNPEIARLLSEQRLMKAELELEQAKAKANWHVSAGVRHRESSNDQALVAGISIPFGKGSRNSGRIAEALANLDRTSFEERALRVHIETSLFVLYEQLQHALHRIEVLNKDIIPPLKRALKETRRAYHLGRYSYLEWRSAQSELLDAEAAIIEASADAQRNIIEIERLTGVRIAQ